MVGEARIGRPCRTGRTEPVIVDTSGEEEDRKGFICPTALFLGRGMTNDTGAAIPYGSPL